MMKALADKIPAGQELVHDIILHGVGEKRYLVKGENDSHKYYSYCQKFFYRFLQVWLRLFGKAKGIV